MADTPVNVERTRSGRVRPVCELCGRKGRAVMPDESGRVSILGLSRGWAVAPYPADFQHRDGSVGDLFTCPACNAQTGRGAPRQSRAYLHTTDDIQGALRAAERAKTALREAGAMD